MADYETLQGKSARTSEGLCIRFKKKENVLLAPWRRLFDEKELYIRKTTLSNQIKVIYFGIKFMSSSDPNFMHA